MNIYVVAMVIFLLTFLSVFVKEDDHTPRCSKDHIFGLFNGHIIAVQKVEVFSMRVASTKWTTWRQLVR